MQNSGYAQGWRASNRGRVGGRTVRQCGGGATGVNRGPRRGARVSRRYFAATLVAFTQLMSYCDTAAELFEFASDLVSGLPA